MIGSLRDLIDETGGCSCHRSPPCGFCTSLTEAEFDAYTSGGLDALSDLADHQDEDTVEVPRTPALAGDDAAF